MHNASSRDCPQCGASLNDSGICAACAFSSAAEDAGPFVSGVRLDDLCPLVKEPEFIGRYKVLARIGEGGMGIVYRAEQQDALRRIVAVKVIRSGLDSDDVLARFDRERQALAALNHENVAQVFDAGTAADGRPFIAMELVEGVPITSFCDQHKLTTRERLDLFVVLCNAVQHAHQKGIIHRDLKPSNILVTKRNGTPWLKIIDFGVAKAIEGKLSDVTMHTRLEQFIGTPAYMSPEQAALGSMDVDTRSDIYSLGVLLYELLTGKPPFDPKHLLECGFDEMRRIVRDVEPVRPSTRLTALEETDARKLASDRNETVSDLIQRLDGDVDCIVLKALEKDRARRYGTATELAADLERYIRNEPVAARRPSVAYRFQKTFRRHRMAFAAGAVIVLSLLTAAVVSTWHARRARQAEQKAVAALSELRASAPVFAQQARDFASGGQFTQALEKLEYAIRLQPDSAEFALLRAKYLEAATDFRAAATAFRTALELAPHDPVARTNLAICLAIVEAQEEGQTNSTFVLLTRLHEQMRREKRPISEVLPISALIGRDKELLIAACIERLQPRWPGEDFSKRVLLESNGLIRVSFLGVPVTDLSPLYGLPIGSLFIGGGQVENNRLIDLNFVKEFPLLEDLRVNGQFRLQDFSGVRDGHRLQRFQTWGTPFTNLSLLVGLPLRELTLRGNRIHDLSPLTNLNLRYLDLTDVPATDFSPLARLSLEELHLSQTRIADLGVLSHQPLRVLELDGCNQIRNLSALQTLANLEIVTLPTNVFSTPDVEARAIDSLREKGKLKQIAVGSVWIPRDAPPASVFWRRWDEARELRAVLRRYGAEPRRLIARPEGTWELDLSQLAIRDLSSLPTNAAISGLRLNATEVRDLRPIEGLALTSLDVSDTPLAELAPVRRMPLKALKLSRTAITDLSALTNAPLMEIALDGSRASDVAALSQIRSLEMVLLPNPARNVELLRALPRLKRISWLYEIDTGKPSQTAVDFWGDWDAQPQINDLKRSHKSFAAGRTGAGWNVTAEPANR